MSIPKSKLRSARVNKLGQVAFDAQFGFMNKFEDFLVHRLVVGSQAQDVTIQSLLRIGWITMDGGVYLSPAIQTGARRAHLALCVRADTISAEELFRLKTIVCCSVGMKAGPHPLASHVGSMVSISAA